MFSSGVASLCGHGFARVLELVEGLSAAETHISLAQLDELLGVLIVHGYAVGCDVHLVRRAAQPRRLLYIPAVRLEHGFFNERVGIVEPHDEFTVVHTRVFVIDDDAPGVAKRWRAIRVRGDAQRYLLPWLDFRDIQLRQPSSHFFFYR